MAAPMSSALPLRQEVAGPDAETRVLHARQLRPGTVLEDTARFSEDVWQLAPAMLQGHHTALSLNFNTLPEAHRLAGKRLCYAMLSGPLPPGELRQSIGSVRHAFGRLKALTQWLECRSTRRTLGSLSPADLQDYQQHLLLTTADPKARRARRCHVRLLWRYRAALREDGLSFDPKHLTGWDEGRTVRATENLTDRIPESVLGPLLTWAIRFVDDFAPDILTADVRRRAHLRGGDGNTDTKTALAKVDRVLDQYRQRSAPLPGRDNEVNLHFLARQAGCSRSFLARQHDRLAAAAAELGIGNQSAYDSPITAHVAGSPWTGGIVAHTGDLYDVARLTRLLQTACYIAIAFLSGMRDSEVKHLQRGCLQVQRNTDGQAYRWIVTSRAFKGQRESDGVQAIWLTGEPAARAIAVLEQLQPPTTAWLFAVLPNNPGVGPMASSGNQAMSGKSTRQNLNHFTTWVNDYCQQRNLAEAIPQVNGQPWRLTTRQFRRTLAWFIARRPGGTVAGAIAYRHQGIQMFEGYAGTSSSGFRAEVESEQALARGEHLLAMIDGHQHLLMAGPARAEVARRLEDFDNNARFAGVISTDPRRLKRLMARQDPAIYPGDYVHCVFDPAKALCLRNRESTPLPYLQQCLPLDCANVAVSTDNRLVWLGEIRTINQQLEDRPPLPPLLATRLKERRNSITAFLDRHPAAAP